MNVKFELVEVLTEIIFIQIIGLVLIFLAIYCSVIYYSYS